MHILQKTFLQPRFSSTKDCTKSIVTPQERNVANFLRASFWCSLRCREVFFSKPLLSSVTPLPSSTTPTHFLISPLELPSFIRHNSSFGALDVIGIIGLVSFCIPPLILPQTQYNNT